MSAARAQPIRLVAGRQRIAGDPWIGDKLAAIEGVMSYCRTGKSDDDVFLEEMSEDTVSML